MPNAAMTYDDVYRHLYHQNTPTEVHYGQSESVILRPARGFVDGFDLTMQTQVGCPAGNHADSGRLPGRLPLLLRPRRSDAHPGGHARGDG